MASTSLLLQKTNICPLVLLKTGQIGADNNRPPRKVRMSTGLTSTLLHFKGGSETVNPTKVDIIVLTAAIVKWGFS
jgi:hypothetical protein